MKNENRPIVITPEILLIATFHKKYPEIKVEGTSLIARIKNHTSNKTRIKVPVSFYDVYFLGKYLHYANRPEKIDSRLAVKDITKAIRHSGYFERSNTDLIYTTYSRSAIAKLYNDFPEELKTAINRARQVERAAKIVQAKRQLKAAENAKNAPQKLADGPITRVARQELVTEDNDENVLGR